MSGFVDWCTKWSGVAEFGGLAITVLGFCAALLKLRKQQESVDAARDAVNTAMAEIRERYVAASLSETRWELTDFVRSCHSKDWGRALMGGDRLRFLLVQLQDVNGLSDEERGHLRGAGDDVRLICTRLRTATPKPLSRQALERLDGHQEALDRMYARRSVPALTAGGTS